jgi:hypothetical protein
VENVLRLVREPDLTERHVHNAFEESRKYTWQAVRDRWLQVYRELMAGQA